MNSIASIFSSFDFSKFSKKPIAYKVGLVLIIITIFNSTIGYFLVPYDAIELNLANRFSPPSIHHIFGTDDLGRDVFSRVIQGSRVSIFIAFLVLVIAGTIGILIGCIAGFMGGLTDEILMRITDAFLAFPPLLLALAIAAAMDAGVFTTVASLSVAFWPYYARLIRAQVISLKEQDYILAAISLGASNFQIILHHLLPNLIDLIIVKVALDISYTILSASALSYLGIGVQKPIPEWGAMMFESRNYFREAWWSVLFPGIALALTCVGFNLFGDSLRSKRISNTN